MRILLAGALALLVSVPASAQIRKFQDWIAACDNARNCVAYSWNRDSYNAYLRIQRDGAPSADARLTLAISSDGPTTFKVEAAADPGPFPPGEISGLPVEDDRHIRLSAEAPAKQITAWVRKTQKLIVYQLDPPLSDPDDRKLDGIALTGAVAALAWIDERQGRSGSETAFGRDQRQVYQSLAQQPFSAPSPAGWPDDTASWSGSDAIKKRLEWANAVSRRMARGSSPTEFLDKALGPIAGAKTRQAVARAESAEQGFTLALMSPEFQRR